jgi:cysteinyl-tRNA synthetase
MDEVLALNLQKAIDVSPDTEDDAELKREIDAIVAQRAEAKKAKDFAKADNLRQALRERGIVLEDGPEGTTWRKLT